MKLIFNKQRGQASVDLVGSLIMFTVMMGFLASMSVFLYINNVFTTAASMGARTAAVEGALADAGTFSQGESAVKQVVKDFVGNSTGITLEDSDISVSMPTGTFGERTVTVQIVEVMESPVKVMTLLNNMREEGSSGHEDEFTISASATMHYEE
ncbi:MAG: hypothetical protein KC476_08060 [Cyanobacteria bacterium HKST-UBA06]|nr:hypothetical protein [Cyanobacteria bacterium HKST-UBA05]MCA9798218.1 hypothetical protein [Cyanobacteria bacterium HKST-UBA04]MCA9807894.1 hypothetical protein [Cyanobacteria bacterium HKST-UBA06]MCA9840738.1 hypothetical protein [Cyanobacteria bacterium HKST-UBA03]